MHGRGASVLLELDLQMVVRHIMWVLGTKPRFPERLECALNH